MICSLNGTSQNDTESGKTGRPSSPRKSVSFTPDTKTEDGFSASNFFKAWAAEQNGAEGEEPAGQPESPSKEPKEKKKKVKKSKSTSLDAKASSEKSEKKAKKKTKADEKSPKETPQYVQYLQQYHTDKDNWKFNKNSQTDLFKNLFNIYRIPPEHNPAIVQYIKGLQGAAARDRVAQDAEDVLKEIWISQNPGDDSMSLESPAARRVAYYNALEKHLERYIALGSPQTEYVDQQQEDLRREAERGKRAEAILKEGLANALSSIPAKRGADQLSVPIPTAIQSSLDKTSEQTPKAKRKRKARTEVSSSEESSSSSDDSSSSESESESD